MVNIEKGYYFCHSFNTGKSLALGGRYEKRSSLTNTPNALRYVRLNSDSVYSWVNRLGLVVVLQKVNNVGDLKSCCNEYDNNFDFHYSLLLHEVGDLLNIKVEAESSFMTYIGSEKTTVEWRIVQVPCDNISISLFVESVFIDLMCRVVDKQSVSFLESTSIVEEKRMVEYVENLFPLAIPSGYLIDEREIKEMGKYYFAWRLSDRVGVIRSRFAESVTNTALYRGHLEKYRQNAMNSFLAAIAVMSLTQVSTDVITVFGVVYGELEKGIYYFLLLLIASIFLMYGIVFNIIIPFVVLWYDRVRQKLYTKTLLKKISFNKNEVFKI